MKAVIATASIQRTMKLGQAGDKAKGIAPVKPVIKVIAPGTLFVPRNEAELADLLRLNAVRYPDKRDEGPAVDRDEDDAEAGAAALEEEKRRATARVLAERQAREAEQRRKAAAEQAEADRLAAEEAARLKAEEEQAEADRVAAEEKAAAEEKDAKKKAAKKPAKGAADTDGDDGVV